MEKKLIIVASPPASGKTYVSGKIAESIHNIVYLDKDTLVPLSNVAYEVTGQQKDREGPFFKKYIRDVEYDVVLAFAYEALKYADIVLINAPFSSEVRKPEYVAALRKKLREEYNAGLAVVWVQCSVETIHQRMIERNSPRDVYKLKNWDEYVKSQNYSIPDGLAVEGEEYSLILFDNNSPEAFEKSLKRTVEIITK